MRRTLLAVLAGGLALHLLVGGLGLGGPTLEAIAHDELYNALLFLGAAVCLARAVHEPVERGAWACFGLGLLSFATGELIGTLNTNTDQGVPAPSDWFWLAAYPLNYAGVILLLRSQVRRFHATLWLDGLIGVLAVSAFVAAVVLEPVARADAGIPAIELLVNLAYPIGDIVLLGFVVFAIAICGWRLSGRWMLIAGALVATALADTLFVINEALAAPVYGTVIESLWLVAPVLLGWAAWRPVTRMRPAQLDGLRLVAMPCLFALLALGVLVASESYDVGSPAKWLARLALLTLIVNLALLAATRREAVTDSLTKLGNRRKLIDDLEEALAGSRLGADRDRVLVLFDLDGFKHYNDSYGHPAGDALLARLAERLQAAVASYDGAAYRMGGDEFCALVPAAEHDLDEVVITATEALSDSGEGFAVTCSSGVVGMPDEAHTAPDAIKLADQRMYADKAARRVAPGSPPAEVVPGMAVREAAMELHGDVESLAVEVARRMGFEEPRLKTLARAARLHGVGKIAIPSAMLHKAGPLEPAEWEFVRQHSVIGERIIGGTPAMADIAQIVHATPEHFDGSGYPDGLAGEAIPLEARIISVCDAYVAMTSERAYRPAWPRERAIAELDRCAGTQFDPLVVAACTAELERRAALSAAATVPAPLPAPSLPA